MQHAKYTRAAEPHVKLENRFVRLDETPVTTPDGSAGSYVTATVGSGFGGVAITRAIARGFTYYCVVEQHRFPIDEVTIEFPRGGTQDLSAEEARRELQEETNCAVSGDPVLLGVIHADTGFLTNQCAVWLFHAQPSEDELFAEPESGATHRWLSPGEIIGMINSGKITCAHTIAAWGLLLSSGRNKVA
ncbi:NUDIX hydrolase [Agromyces sp. NPDC057679]|uniref:NUDIX hydrolase n=1 Tax=Agromyces sp. NPDC057679 TaxID=3346207 RepID=UPI00366E4A1D